MKTLLIFPPASDPAHPPLGISSLAGFMRNKGEDTSLLDLNIHSYLELLSEDNLGRCAKKLHGRIQELESSAELCPDDFDEYRLIVENALSEDFLLHSVSGALADLRDPAVYGSRAQYARASSIVRRGMELVSAAHYPVRWYPRGFSMSYLPTRSWDVMAATANRDQNLFLRLFDSCIENIVDRRPDLIGISLNYYCQLIPCMTLARILKHRLTDTFIVVGGGLVCFFEDKWNALAPFHSLVDGWIPFEGEKPLLDLVRALRRGDSIASVPGLLRFTDGAPVYHSPGPPPCPRELPPPCFDDLPLAEYLSPKPVLPILGSRGCYWGRCAFCSHDQLYRGRFRKKTVVQVIRELRHLADRYHARHFYFTDESLTPQLVRGLSDEVNKGDLPLEWFGEIRFERFLLDGEILQQMKAGGCRMLMFGLESGVERMLDLMEKGSNPQRAAKILRNCREAGIRTFVMFFVGFPTETEAEAARTIEFVESNGDAITHIAFSNFILEQQSPVHKDPDRFGITEILPYLDENLKIYSDYRVASGLTAEQAIRFLEVAQQRPGIRSLIDLYLISRSHLVFLPQEKEPRHAVRRRQTVDFSRPDSLYPIRNPDLTPKTLLFNLQQIRERIDATAKGNESKPLPQHPTNYVFRAQRDRLVDVGKDGIEILKVCNGRFSLREILNVTGEHNQGKIINFLSDLQRAELLRWEVRE